MEQQCNNTINKIIYIPRNSIHSFWEFATYTTILRQKALRALYFGMKKYVNTKNVPKSATFKLFDSLIVHVATYGSQIWLPTTKICKNIFRRNYTHTQMANSTSDQKEKLHLNFLKWTLEVPKGTSNAAVYGDTGRIPFGSKHFETVFKFCQPFESA